MKNCPYCGSAIEENARVCLYCMKELEPKAQMKVAHPRLRRWMWPLFAALLVVIIGVVAFFLWPKKTPAPETEQGGQAVIGEEELSPVQQPEKDIEGEDGESKSAAKAPTSNGTAATEKNNNTATGSGGSAPSGGSAAPSGSKQETGGQKGSADPEDSAKEQESGSTDSQQSAKDQQSSGGQESTNDQESAKDQQSSGDQESTNDQESTKEQQSSNEQDNSSKQESTDDQESSQEPENTPAPPAEATYLYRAAKYAVDDYLVTANVDDCVVITGVSTPASDGIYRLPSTLGGKKVIAVAASAFNDAAIRDTVKAVYIPASIRTVWSFAFSGCVNLTDVYFYGTSIYVDVQAFAPKERRNGTLTIHCGKDCNNRDFRYYRNIAESYYDAVYKEWNG